MQQEPFEIRQLRYFLEVADACSFSRAAKRLGVSQPAVSQQLRDLETGVRAVLLQRRGKRTMLTPAGLLFQEHAHAILRQIDQSLQELSSGPRDPHGTLRVGVIQRSISVSWKFHPPKSRRNWRRAGWMWASAR
jgi:DNA-binding transcriptional LysR family regulator